MNEEKKLGTLDKYISTTYIPLHIVAITISTLMLMISVTLVSQKYLWHLFIAGSIVITLLISGAYYISYKIKSKKNKLNEHKIKFVWQTVYIATSLVWMCVLAMLCGLAQVMLVTVQ